MLYVFECDIMRSPHEVCCNTRFDLCKNDKTFKGSFWSFDFNSVYNGDCLEPTI